MYEAIEINGKWPCPVVSCARQYTAPRTLFRHVTDNHPHMLNNDEPEHHSPTAGTPERSSIPPPGNDRSQSPRARRTGSSSAPGNLHYTPYPGAGLPTAKPAVIPYYKREGWNPWAPFCCSAEFNLAQYFIKSEASEAMIDEYFNSGAAAPYPDHANPGQYHEPTFRTAQKLFQQLSKLQEYPPGFRTCDILSVVRKEDTVPFYYRDIKDTIKYIAEQPCFEYRFKTAPAVARLDDENGERVYADLHTALWWNRKQSELADPSGTIIPLFFASDGVQLTQLSGSKKVWPIYIAIGNVPLEDRMKLDGGARILVGFLPLPPPQKDSQIHDPEEQTERNRAVTAACLAKLLAPLREMAQDSGFLATCANGLQYNFFPRLVSWIADHKEAAMIHNVLSSRCVKCETKPAEFENYIAPQDLRSAKRSQAR